MVEEIARKYYVCSICKHEYDTKAEALSCESKPITQDKGVKIGDIVLITNGQSMGNHLRVKQIWIIDKYWGHYAWERYWHTPCLSGKVIESTWASRQLTFDCYETEAKNND